MNVVGIDHVQLAIPPGGEAQARAFYSGVLGFAEVPKPAAMLARAGGLWFQAGPVGIHIGIEPDMRPSVKAHPAIVVDDLDGFVARLTAAGCKWAPSDEMPETYRGHTWDPFGNRIELIQH
ncbi:MAG: VOC family protein [Myxococcota bacterium]|nr:VOC family protein [Deltaproteobacteria bacterium]MDQ3340081.1 VOC family protein [Myxococcota bacterium]